ncbi:hypothetical protein J2747_001325 [Thermococcus stetteri]|nr:hypothetical protein [Thermococcus stetteri]
MNNTIKDSRGTGVYMYNSTGNVFYLTHFENPRNAIIESSTARWYSPDPISYNYTGTAFIIPGTQFTNYIGNYWSDYTGRDTNGDGIGEEPYYIDANNSDPYPISYMIKPIVLTDLAVNVTNTSAVLRGTLLDMGGSTSVKVWFEYGSDPTEGYDAILTWINGKGHAVISNGPFYLDYYDPSTQVIELRAFRDHTYPFTIDEIKQMIGLGDYEPPSIMNFKVTPQTVDVGNTTNISWMVADESGVAGGRTHHRGPQRNGSYCII